MTDQPLRGSNSVPSAARFWGQWVVRAVGAAGTMVVGWAAVTAWGAIAHGHPAYAVVLAVALFGSVLALGLSFRPGPRVSPRRLLFRGVLLLAGLAWIAMAAWLRPFQAVEPALSALLSDERVIVAESPTRIVLAPAGVPSPTGVLFQPGARVDPRAYAAVLRPVAEAGHVVVIAKPPVGIAFLSLTALDAAKADHPHVDRWVVGGHSLGGTVAAQQADGGDTDPVSPVVGLVLYASYPAGDLTTSLQAAVLSVSGSRDGLATPGKIAASRDTLPAATVFTIIEGANHAFFGDYGPQPGDGAPTVDHDRARAEISAATVSFVARLSA